MNSISVYGTHISLLYKSMVQSVSTYDYHVDINDRYLHAVRVWLPNSMLFGLPVVY